MLASKQEKIHRFLIAWAPVLVALVVAAAWWKGLDAPFLLDDHYNIVANPAVRNPSPWWQAFWGPDWIPNAGRPLTQASFALDRILWGMSPAGFHVTNLLIHIANGLLFFALCREFFRSPALEETDPRIAGETSLFAALFWVAHPLFAGAVTYISQRAESLSALFLLITLYGAARGLTGRRGWLAVSAFSFFLGVLSKETIVAAPFLVLLAWAVLYKKGGREMATAHPAYLFSLAAGFGVLALLLSTGRTYGVAEAKGSPMAYLAGQPVVIFGYLRKFFLPSGLCFDIHFPPPPLWRALVFGAGIAALAGLTFFGLARRKAWGFAGAWFFLTLAPASSFFPLKDASVEYRMLVPGMAVAALVAYGILALATRLFREKGSPAAWALLSFLVLALIVASNARNRVFASPGELWRDTVAKSPVNPRARVNLGRALLAEGNPKAAMEEFRIALSLAPDSGMALANLGAALYGTGDYEAALENLDKALLDEPKNAGIHLLRGRTLKELGRYDESARAYRRAMELYPGWITAARELDALPDPAHKGGTP